jgi:hypothetical protein
MGGHCSRRTSRHDRRDAAVGGEARPLNRDLTALIGELPTAEPAVPSNWAQRDVHEHRTGRKVYRHPGVGDLDMTLTARNG